MKQYNGRKKNYFLPSRYAQSSYFDSFSLFIRIFNIHSAQYLSLTGSQLFQLAAVQQCSWRAVIMRLRITQET